jgi:hypothetical protein
MRVSLSEKGINRHVYVGLRMSVDGLMESNGVAVLEAISVARDRNHVPSVNTSETLKDRGIIGHDGVMHESIREILLAVAVGEGIDVGIDWSRLKP